MQTIKYLIKHTAHFILILFLFAPACASISNKNKQNLNPSTLDVDNAKGAFATNKYRNLFNEIGHPEQEVKHKMETAFKQLYYGDSSTQKIYYNAGKNANGTLAYILDVYNKDIRSEGMSYGMMIAVQLDKKEEFNAIWNYAMTYMYTSDTAHPSAGYFAWSLKRDGTPNSETAAPDGEEYFVMALYFAAGRWGNGNGIYNYKAWANTILSNMRHHGIKTGHTKRGSQTVGPMVNEEKKMILFVPNGPGSSFSDPSYHLPHFYELWARWGPVNDRAFWLAAADTSRKYFHKATHPKTGLSSDYAHFNGEPVITSFNENSKHFAYDSWRAAMNWSIDWSWWQKDTGQQVLSNRIQIFFASQGMDTYGSVYTIDGKPVVKGRGAGLIATNAVASLAANHSIAGDFVEALWKEPVPSQVGRYYGGLLYLMSLLHCSGEFKIYTPG